MLRLPASAERPPRLEVAIRVDGQVWAGDVRELVRIDESILREQIRDHSEFVAWFGVLHAAALRDLEEAEAGLEELEADLYVYTRQRLLQEMPPSQLKESHIKAEIRRNQESKRRRRDMIAKRHTLKQIDALSRALLHRRDMIETLGEIERGGGWLGASGGVPPGTLASRAWNARHTLERPRKEKPTWQ